MQSKTDIEAKRKQALEQHETLAVKHDRLAQLSNSHARRTYGAQLDSLESIVNILDWVLGNPPTYNEVGF